jgi:teichoic acid ribitol-phosphate primase
LTRLEYLLSSALLRVLGAIFRFFPRRRRTVVLATARLPYLEGNLYYIHEALRRLYPQANVVKLLEPYSYGLAGKLAYLLRVARGMYHLQTARLFIVDNAYLPVHVAPHRSGTTVVQVWHAVGAMKRFGVDTATPLAEPERTFLHRYYDWVIVSSEATRPHVAAALRTPLEQTLALGTPRTDFFFDEVAMAAARQRVLERYPQLDGRRVVLYAPTFRGRGRARTAAGGFDAVRARAALPADYVLVLKAHPNLSPTATDTAGFDVVVDQQFEINDLLTATDVLLTDYSSSIFEWALLRRPLVLLLDDLDEYEREPGLYIDFRREMIGTHVTTTDEAVAAIVDVRYDLSDYDAFIERHLGACDGRASERFVEHFVGGERAAE